jgi:iron complex outermembrane receptor protein
MKNAHSLRRRPTSRGARRIGLLASAASALALAGLPAVALAQDADNAAEGEAGAASTDIIVTAQRRSERLQDVPAAVTALNAEDLQQRQIFNSTDIAVQVPGVVITAGTGTANSARIFFRGVGEDESRGAVDPAIGIYIDNVYLGRTVGSLFDLVDIAQVEVLRGPQGTLYGRNTNGGAIKFTSVTPKLGENSFSGEVGYGNYNRVRATGIVNAALADSLAVRVAGLYARRDGFWKLNPNGAFAAQAGTEVGEQELFSVRASLYGEMSPRWSVKAVFDYTKDNSDPSPSSLVDRSSNPAVVTDRDRNIFTIEPAPNVTCSAATPANFLPIGCFTNYGSEVETWGASIQLEGDYDSFAITSISALRAMKDDLKSFISFPFFQQTEQYQVSQELLVNTSLDGPVNFTAGAYYYYEDVNLDYQFIFPFSNDVVTESFSLFGQARLALTDALTLTGGLRWIDESRDFVGNAGGPLAGFGTNIVRRSDISDIVWTAKADYKITEDVMVYASYATGIKTPGVSSDCFSPLACFRAVDQEELDSIEVGLRSQFWDRRGTFNITYFNNDYQDLQISGTLPNGAFTRINAGKARIQGIEVEAQLRPVDGLTLYANGSWLDAEYRRLDFDQAGLLSNSTNTVPGLACTNVTATPNTEQYRQQVIECALGLEMKNAPEWKLLGGFVYDFALGDGDFFIGSDIAYESDSFGLVANVPGTKQQPGVRIDARMGYTTGPWRFTVWGKNLTDREYFRANTFNVPTRQNQVFAAPPLTVGFDIGFQF